MTDQHKFSFMSPESYEAMLDQHPSADINLLLQQVSFSITNAPARYAKYGELLLDHRADVNARARGGWTPLLAIAGSSGRELEYFLGENAFSFRDLLVRGADVNARNNDGKTVLHLVIKNARSSYIEQAVEACELFLQHGADANAVDSDGKTPLMYAVRGEICKVLLEHGADVNARNKDGQTALHLVVRNVRSSYIEQAAEACEMFLQHGADANAVDNDGKTPPMYAGWGKICEVLLEHGAVLSDKVVKDFFSEQFKSEEELIKLQEQGRMVSRMDGESTLEKLQCFDRHGANLSIRDRKDRTPLMNWCRYEMRHLYTSRLEAVKILQKHQKSINMCDADRNTLLHLLNNKLPNDVLDFLMIECKPLTIIRNLEGRRPLDIYIEKSRPEWSLATGKKTDSSLPLIRRLLQRKVDLNYCDKTGLSPLHAAVRKNALSIVELFLREGDPDLEIRDLNGNTPLMYAPSVEMAELLLREGAQVDARNNEGRQPLHILDWTFDKLLLDFGADINARDNRGNTPLHCASMITPKDGRWYWPGHLVKLGADENARNLDGHTPAEVMPKETRIWIDNELSEEARERADFDSDGFDGPDPLTRLEEKYSGDDNAIRSDPEYWDYLYGLAED